MIMKLSVSISNSSTGEKGGTPDIVAVCSLCGVVLGNRGKPQNKNGIQEMRNDEMKKTNNGFLQQLWTYKDADTTGHDMYAPGIFYKTMEINCDPQNSLRLARALSFCLTCTVQEGRTTDVLKSNTVMNR